jgi:hypothetical protein
MTFNEWWAGQNLPEESRVVALAAWYASQLYGEHTAHPAVFTAPRGLSMAHGHQLDVIGATLGLTRTQGTENNPPETDQSYRERLCQKRREIIAKDHDARITPPRRDGLCAHQWIRTESKDICSKCGVPL